MEFERELHHLQNMSLVRVCIALQICPPFPHQPLCSCHCQGGTFLFVNKLSGNIARTIDALVTSQYTPSHFKPKLEVDRRNSPHHAIDGLAQGSEFLS
jgi:hypothetical protein